MCCQYTHPPNDSANESLRVPSAFIDEAKADTGRGNKSRARIEYRRNIFNLYYWPFLHRGGVWNYLKIIFEPYELIRFKRNNKYSLPKSRVISGFRYSIFCRCWIHERVYGSIWWAHRSVALIRRKLI